MASKVVAFLTLCCLLLATKQVAAGRGNNKSTRKLVADNNNEAALYTDILNNPTKYTTPQNDTPKYDMTLKEDVLHNEILKNPAKFNAILNDTALINDPAKIIELNETAVFNEILHNPIKYINNNQQYSTVLNDTAMKNVSDVGNYNTLMGFWGTVGDLFHEWVRRSFTDDEVPNSQNTAEYNTVSNDAANNNSTDKYNTIL